MCVLYDLVNRRKRFTEPESRAVIRNLMVSVDTFWRGRHVIVRCSFWSQCSLAVEHPLSKREVVGSNPAIGFFGQHISIVVWYWAGTRAEGRSALLAQWLERAAVNRKVTGSIPVGSAFFFFSFSQRRAHLQLLHLRLCVWGSSSNGRALA